MQGAASLQEGRAQEALARWSRTETCPGAAQVVFCSPVTLVETQEKYPFIFFIFADPNPIQALLFLPLSLKSCNR